MATLNIAGNQVVYSLGALIAIIVLIVSIILLIIGTPLTAPLVLGGFALLALARLT